MAKRAEIPPEYPQPPAGTSARARELWLEVVQSFPLGYFVNAHRQRLYTYTEACAMAEKLRKRLIRMTDPEAIKGIVPVIRMQEMTALQEARALRITNQSIRQPSENPTGRAQADNPTMPAGEATEESQPDWMSLPFSQGNGRPN